MYRKTGATFNAPRGLVLGFHGKPRCCPCKDPVAQHGSNYESNPTSRRLDFFVSQCERLTGSVLISVPRAVASVPEDCSSLRERSLPLAVPKLGRHRLTRSLHIYTIPLD